MPKQEQLEKIRHSTAHLLAAAVLELYPATKLAIGPAIRDGFYYDFDFAHPISEEDLPKIEKKMRELLKSWKDFTRIEVSPAEAAKRSKGNPYKLELIDEFAAEGKKLTLYKSGRFVDLCKGDHVGNPAEEIGPFKLTHLAGAYWRGSEKNPMLTRIYGTAWSSGKELTDYLARLEEAKKRDHRKLGPALGLFMFHETAPGMPYWLPKGLFIYNKLVEYWRSDYARNDYLETKSPLLNKKELYETSGHWQFYKQDMFISRTPDGETYGLKPMNCPNAMVIFGNETRSYRDLPLRLADLDILHRFERSGTLAGLFRVREFAQDDAHIFVREDQVQEEYARIFKIASDFYSAFDLRYSFRLGTRPEKYLGEKSVWDKAEHQLLAVLKKSKVSFEVLAGDGAFYGPKIDILMEDSLGREWQMGTVQLDFQMPQRFKLKFTDKGGREMTPVVIHRALAGSFERFLGIIIEHYGGAFPLWLSPIQASILTVSSKPAVVRHARDVFKKLTVAGLRAELTSPDETIGKKIRRAEVAKIPYIIVIGEKEAKNKKVAVRMRGKGDLGAMNLEKFIKMLHDETKRTK